MADVREWKDAEQKVLDALDIVMEYKSLGVSFTRDHPTQKGWLPCHAIDRKDNNASAAVFVGNGPSRGRFRDMGGDGLSLNLWEFAARFGGFGGDWKEARKSFARKAGVSLPGGGEPKRPADQVEFLDTPAGELILDAWAGLKGGFDLQTIKECGGRYGRYPKKARPEGSQYVAAFPGYSPPGRCDSDPVAWVIANTTGHPVTIYRGQGKPPTESKTVSVGGSTGGLLGAWGLAHLDDAEWVWKCEGLTDLLTFHHALRQAGLLGRHVVISNSQGSLETVKPEWVEMLKGKKVNVVQDCDRPGQTGAARWCQALCESAEIVRNVALPYAIKEAHGEDLRDFLFRDGRPVQELLDLAEKAKPYRPEDMRVAKAAEAAAWRAAPGRPPEGAGLAGLFDGPASGEAAAPQPGTPPEIGELDDALALVQLVVLGRHEDHSVSVYSRHRRETFHIPNVPQMKRDLLVQIAGDPAVLHVHDGKEEVEGKVRFSAVRTAIAYRAGGRHLDSSPPLGQGCWRAEGGVVLVNGNEAALYKGGRLEAVTAPCLGGSLLGLRATKPWVDLDALRGHLASASDAGWRRAVLEEASGLFSSWSWKHGRDADVMAALAACSWVQTLWPWRPEVAIAGGSDSGKTTLVQNALAKLFGELAWFSNKPTEAGVRQHIGHDARVIILDEFEQDGQRQKVLEMFRATSQGGLVHRGTSDQRGRSVRVQHIPWVASIETGLTKAADRNRFIILDLGVIPVEKRGAITLPDADALAGLGARLLAVALASLDDAVGLFKGLKATQVEGVHGRVVENYAVPAALRAAALGLGPEQAVAVLKGFLGGRRTDQGQIVADERALLNAIAESKVELGRGERSVAEILAGPHLFQDGHTDLERQGVARVTGENKKGRRPTDLAQLPLVFVNADMVKRYLLKSSDWCGKDIDQLLLRVAGAFRDVRRLAGKVASGVCIPVGAFGLDGGDDADEELPEDPPPKEEPPKEEPPEADEAPTCILLDSSAAGFAARDGVFTEEDNWR